MIKDGLEGSVVVNGFLNVIICGSYIVYIFIVGMNSKIGNLFGSYGWVNCVKFEC